MQYDWCLDSRLPVDDNVTRQIYGFQGADLIRSHLILRRLSIVQQKQEKIATALERNVVISIYISSVRVEKNPQINIYLTRSVKIKHVKKLQTAVLLSAPWHLRAIYIPRILTVQPFAVINTSQSPIANRQSPAIRCKTIADETASGGKLRDQLPYPLLWSPKQIK
ncbi:hypothetical protein EAF00_002394 [Botryotinia globosa]|nr:hypothetical protein EAF00_002394 [Botryotinia globosa]